MIYTHVFFEELPVELKNGWVSLIDDAGRAVIYHRDAPLKRLVIHEPRRSG